MSVCVSDTQSVQDDGRVIMKELNSRRCAVGLRTFFVLLTVSIVFGMSVQMAQAQTSRGTVTGKVIDPNGAVIPGATVTLTNVDTNVERTTMTTGEGVYRFDAVDLGNYKIVFTAAGFSNLENTDIIVSANQTAVVDVELRVGAIE